MKTMIALAALVAAASATSPPSMAGAPPSAPGMPAAMEKKMAGLPSNAPPSMPSMPGMGAPPSASTPPMPAYGYARAEAAPTALRATLQSYGLTLIAGAGVIGVAVGFVLARALQAKRDAARATELLS